MSSKHHQSHGTASVSVASSPVGALEQDVVQEQDGLMVVPQHLRIVQPNGAENDEMLLHKTTELQSFLHLLKGYVGPGCLSLPLAVSQLGGGLFGCATIFAVAIWTSYNSWTVVRLKLCMQQQAEQEQHAHVVVDDDEDCEEEDATSDSSSNSFRSTDYRHRVITYPQVSRWLYGRTMEKYTAGCVCVQQLSVCTVFLSFVGANLQAVLQAVVSVEVSHFTVITAALPACMALSCLPDLKALAPVTAAGTFLLFVGLGLLLTMIVLEWDKRPSSDTVTLQWSAVPLAVCAILYSFEGICLILPVESSMARPRRFFPVFVTAMLSSATIFCAVAGLSVAAFGKVTNGSITAFLLEKYVYDDSVAHDSYYVRSLLLLANAAVSFSVLITYPLQLFPCLELIGPFFTTPNGSSALTEQGGQANFVGLTDEEEEEEEQNPNDDDHRDETAMLDSPQARVFLVMLTYVAAVAIPNVESLISLSGALAGSSTALLIPPALQIAHHKQHGVSKDLVLSYLLFIGGFVFMVIGTGASIMEIIQIYAGS